MNARLALSVGVTLLVAGCATTSSLTPQPLPPPQPTLAAAGSALDLELPLHPGRSLWALKSLRGKVVLLDVWATWCDPCRDALPLYQDFGTEYATRGLEVVTINVDSDPQQLAPFLAEAKITVPVLLDPDAHVAESQLRVKLMPTAFLIDRRGVVRFVHEGFDEGELKTWISQLETLLAEPAP